jgi:uncharacterized protein
VGQTSLGAKVDDLLANIRKSIDSDIESLSGGTPTRTSGTLMRGALREMRVSLVPDPVNAPATRDDISDLRSRIKKKMADMESEPVAPAIRTAPQPEPFRPSTAVVPARGDFSGILSGPSLRPTALRPSYAETDTRDEVRYAPQPRVQAWPEPEPETADYNHNSGQPDPYAHQYAEQMYSEQAYEQQHYPPLVSPQTAAHAESAFQQLSDAILSRATGERSLEDMTRDMLKGMLKQWLDANLPAIVEDMVREEIQRVARRGR